MYIMSYRERQITQVYAELLKAIKNSHQDSKGTYGIIKVEMIYQHKFETRKQAWREIFEYIEMFYNRKRRHQALDYLSPEQFLKQHHEQKTTNLKKQASRNLKF
jgi:hypothetical protein